MTTEDQSPTTPDTAAEALDTAAGSAASGAGAAGSGAGGARKGGAKRVILVTVIGLVVLALAVYGTGYALSGDRAPRNATIAGIGVGGMSRAEATAKIADEFETRTAREITLTVDDETVVTSPAELGFGVDAVATINQIGIGRSLDPRHIWTVLAGGGEADPVVTVDQGKLDAFLNELSEKIHRDPVDATVSFAKSKVKYTSAVQGRDLDVAAAEAALKDGFLDADTIDLPVELVDPEITDDLAADAREKAEKIVSDPVILQVKGGGKYEIPVQDLAKAYSFEVRDGKLVAVLDSKELLKLSQEGLDDLATEDPVNARVEIRDGKPYIVSSKDGNEITEKILRKAVEDTVGASGKERSTTVTPNGKKADYTTEDAKEAGVKEIVGEFTTYFPYAEYRNINLSVAARLINNAFLKPGDQFSLNQRIGERTEAKGFVYGSVIEGGRLVQGLAGGISQSATTVYNAAFFSGLQLDQWQPHTLYFDRYPAGRESTVYLPTIDVKFTNNTPHGVVVQAFVNKAGPGTQGSMTVRVWSTKHFVVESPEPTKEGFYNSGVTRWVDAPNCAYQAPIQGFTARYHRNISDPSGKFIKREDFVWKYSAGDEIRCGKKPEPKKDDDDDDSEDD